MQGVGEDSTGKQQYSYYTGVPNIGYLIMIGIPKVHLIIIGTLVISPITPILSSRPTRRCLCRFDKFINVPKYVCIHVYTPKHPRSKQTHRKFYEIGNEKNILSVPWHYVHECFVSIQPSSWNTIDCFLVIYHSNVYIHFYSYRANILSSNFDWKEFFKNVTLLNTWNISFVSERVRPRRSLRSTQMNSFRVLTRRNKMYHVPLKKKPKITFVSRKILHA